MSLEKLTDTEAVREAITEFNSMGREAFLQKYGFGQARAHFLRINGKYYDSKAICGAAFGFQYPDQGPLRNEEFSGGDATVKRRLNELGFAVTDSPPNELSELVDRLSGIKAYQRSNYTAPHKAIVLLIVLNRYATDQRSTWGLTELDSEVQQALSVFDARTDSSLEPIWRLQSDGLAEITQGTAHLIDRYTSGDPPPKSVLIATDVKWSLPDRVVKLLEAHPDIVDDLIDNVVAQLDDDQQAVAKQWLQTATTEFQEASTNDPTRFWGRTPRAWVVRAGNSGADEQFCLEHNVCVIGWHKTDFTQPTTKAEVRTLMEEHWGSTSPQSIPSFTTQVWRFIGEISIGDIVVIPHIDKTKSDTVAIGVVTGEPRFDPTAEESQRHQRTVEWKRTDVPRTVFGDLVRYLDAPMTVQTLDDNMAERLQHLIDHGTFNLTWWVNQGHSYDFEVAATCICAPRKTTRGHVLRYWADVGRVLTGDTVIHYSKGSIVGVSTALTDGEQGRRPYGPDGDMDGWQPDVYIARCSYDSLWEDIPLSEVSGRTSEVGPFTSTGGVKQGYFWPVTHDFLQQLITDHADRLRGTVLNPGNIWLFQANPAAEHTQFPQRLTACADSDDAAQWNDTWSVTRYMNDMRAGDRVLFWFSGKDAGIYGSGLLKGAPYDAEPDPITGSSTKIDLRVNINHANDPLLKEDLKDDSELGDLHVINVPNGTNFKATQENWDAYLRRIATRPHDTTNESEPEGNTMTLADLTNQLHLSPADTLNNIVELFNDRPQAIFYGPPGTGKTFIARKLAEHLTTDGGATKLVQFHPSYAYEDFVEGWRPTPDGKFELRDGALKTFAQQAANDPNNTYVMVIDEINRANLSKVLGELFFLLEYRNDTATLQYSDTEFALPPNMRIIGTMNTADRSIAMVDAALRRRFHFHAFFPTEPPINGALHRYLNDHHPTLTWVADMVDKANALLPDRNLGIGPSHFMRPNLTEQLIERIWTHSILPYIEDNFDYDHTALEPFTYHALKP